MLRLRWIVKWNRGNKNIKHVLECVFQVLAKFGTIGKVTGTSESHIIFTQCIGDDQMWFLNVTVIQCPIRYIIRIRVRIIFKSTFVDDLSTGIQCRLYVYTGIHHHEEIEVEGMISSSHVRFRRRFSLEYANAAVPVTYLSLIDSNGTLSN